jgi:dipeptidyl-peptidase-4
MLLFRRITFLALLSIPTLLLSQEKLTMADAILKARGLSPENLSQLQWIPGTQSFSHLANGTKIVRVQAPSLTRDTLALLDSLNAVIKSKDSIPLTRLPGIQWTDANTLWFQHNSKIYTYGLNGALQEKNTIPQGAENTDMHDKSFNVAYTAGDELRVRVAGTTSLVAKSEEKGIVYGKSVHRDEFGIFKGTFWSPTGRYLGFYRMDESMVTEYPIYVLDSMPAQARTIRYPFAGAASHHVTVGVFDTQTGKNIFLKTGEPAEQYLTNIAWSPDDRYILIAVVNRGQNHLWLNQYDAQTGAFVKTLFEETAETWVEPEHPAEFVPGSNTQFIWQSERDGYNHLYLYDLSGKMIRQISSGNMPVVNFIGFTTDGAQCFYQCADSTGMSRHAFTASLDGKKKPQQLTLQSGTHQPIFSADGQWMLDNFSDMITPRRILLAPVQKPSDRKIVFSAPNPIGSYVTGQTNFLQLRASDSTLLNARMILPPGFDPNKKYPAIVYVYGGPHAQLVSNTWMGAGELWMHRMALEGFIMFTLDGRGSAYRGHAFESAVFRRLGDLEIQDQLTGVQYLKGQGFVDSTRLGVYGWSYGGFMATSLMTRPESNGVFKCGIAGGPVIDWRMYEIMYTERYMDTPQENPEGYAKNSLFNYIDNLNGRLLMIHGSSDDVVLWQHTLRYIRECVRKGKAIDYFAYPEHAHNVRGRDRVHLFEKIERFFKDNL